MAFRRLQTAKDAVLDRIERWLEAERDQLPLWIPVGLGAGIALWFVVPLREGWIAVLAMGFGMSTAGAALGSERRLGRVLLWAGMLVAAGCALAWFRAEHVAAPRIARPLVATFEARIERIELQGDGEKVRFLLEPERPSGLPRRLRVSAALNDVPPGIAEDATVRVRARLVPPPEAAVPGGYDFQRAAWFLGIGGTGKALDPVRQVSAATVVRPSLRDRMTAHIRTRLDGSEGGIATAFATGDRGGIAEADEEAMRASGLTHLLSISGLHITAIVAAVMFFTLRLMALSRRLALTAPLIPIAAGMGALAGIGYTLLTGAELPTIRACVAALLVVAGLMLGRDALTLRLVATGAVVILLLWPEALVGPSFQLSFAAITAIVALHEHRAVRAFMLRRDERLLSRFARSGVGLLITGIAVELTLAPIALFHFHKSGLYGALANIVAIPLTTFVVMPLEALALAFDLVGLGQPFWWATGKSLGLLLWLARRTAELPGAVAALPSLPLPAFSMMLGGGLWLLLWKTRPRYWGAVPIAFGALWAISVPAPDLLVTGDGRHLALRATDGQMGLLRERTGDYIRETLAERAGETEPLGDLANVEGSRCSRDLCAAQVERGGKGWRIVATRSAYRLPWREFIEQCRSADIVVSDRRLPDVCKPHWLKVDKTLLEKSGGLAIDLASPHVESVFRSRDDHPWLRARAVSSAARALRAGPARAPGSARSAEAGRSGSPDRAGPSTLRGGNI